MRIFTPTFEMPFAGHPTLGTAHVVRALARAGDAITLEMRAGLIHVTAIGDEWTLAANPPRSRLVDDTRVELAAMLGIATDDVLDGARWVDTGVEQLLVPLRSPESVRRCRPDPALLARHARDAAGRYHVYVFAESGTTDVRARFFFEGVALTEDPATGSGCANLGGWFVAANRPRPLTRTVHQGDEVGRPSRLGLRVDANGGIFVCGGVVEVGWGVVAV